MSSRVLASAASLRGLSSRRTAMARLLSLRLHPQLALAVGPTPACASSASSASSASLRSSPRSFLEAFPSLRNAAPGNSLSQRPLLPRSSSPSAQNLLPRCQAARQAACQAGCLPPAQSSSFPPSAPPGMRASLPPHPHRPCPGPHFKGSSSSRSLSTRRVGCNPPAQGKEDRRQAQGSSFRAQAASTAAVGESRPNLAALVVLEEDLHSSMLDQAFVDSVSADTQLLLAQSWGLIQDALMEEQEEDEEKEEEDVSADSSSTSSTSSSSSSTGGVGMSPESVEVSVLLCSDEYIRGLNAEWRGQDKPTDVLSFPQSQPPGLNPTVLLGDIIISVETAERQAAERGHTLRDEIRILMVHGLLHLLGFDHEQGPQEEQEMAEEEAQVLAALGWHVEGLIASAARASADSASAGEAGARAGAGAVRAWKPPFKLLLCDMDGTLLNSSSRVSPCTAEALRAATARGVQVAIATGKARPAAMAALATAGLAGAGGVITHQSPGVFIQGLRVYGAGGAVLHNALLPSHVVAQAFEFSLQHGLALIGFSGDHCVTMREHPLVEALHTIYYEPRARVCSTIDEVLNESPIQKLLFYDTEKGIKDFIRPYWAKHLSVDEAALTQAVPDMLEILPPGQSKGSGVQILLDSMGIHPDDVMALGDGENDKEMLEMVGWGVAMGNGSPITKAVAQAIVGSNDEGGIAEAINKFILS